MQISALEAVKSHIGVKAVCRGSVLSDIVSGSCLLSQAKPLHQSISAFSTPLTGCAVWFVGGNVPRH